MNDFAKELIEEFGEDRFYHCCHRMTDSQNTVFLYLNLHKNKAITQCFEFFNKLGLENCSKDVLKISSWSSYRNIPEIKDFRNEMCCISFGFSRYWKEFGLKTHMLPDHIHSRMILGEKNSWVVKYVDWLNQMKED